MHPCLAKSFNRHVMLTIEAHKFLAEKYYKIRVHMGLL